MPRTTLILLLGALLVPGAAFAQGLVAPDQTGTGGGPGTTITAPYTNHLGVTKPPGTSLGPGEVESPRERREDRGLSKRIEKSICDGCN
ncbi:hypothetical protein [Methylobacterium persicinum]|uniref:Uncharacterized protein n=1 Tax=Methylobacterium persicinum TaxID=374426 RepID=A0ABU0HSA2_9HYPH|nr:hypothetical protein [Methylobacterium persicinum]MDQ0444792.1 hypothetical protein [Methylobacterium persicinum]GJE38105.1 hypothetical protein KHHGKMAE_2171 [Methylobacterium persicinum]